MKIKKNILLIAGFGILAVLLSSYFISINEVESEEGLILITKNNLLGIIILHNPFVLGIYILAAIVLIVKGLGRKK